MVFLRFAFCFLDGGGWVGFGLFPFHFVLLGSGGGFFFLEIFLLFIATIPLLLLIRYGLDWALVLILLRLFPAPSVYRNVMDGVRVSVQGGNLLLCRFVFASLQACMVSSCYNNRCELGGGVKEVVGGKARGMGGGKRREF